MAINSNEVQNKGKFGVHVDPQSPGAFQTMREMNDQLLFNQLSQQIQRIDDITREEEDIKRKQENEAKRKLAEKMKKKETKAIPEKKLLIEACINKKFNKFKEKIQNYPKCHQYNGTFLRSRQAFSDEIEKAHFWKNSDFFCLTLMFLAKRGATGDICHMLELFLHQDGIHDIDKWKEMRSKYGPELLSVFIGIKNNEEFFQKCGKLLLIAAISEGQVELVNFLIQVKGIKLNFNLKKGTSLDTPISALLNGYRDNETHVRMLNVLYRKKDDFDRSSYPLFTLPRHWCSSSQSQLVRNLLVLGLNPLQEHNGDFALEYVDLYMGPFREAEDNINYTINLLEFGAGLIDKLRKRGSKEMFFNVRMNEKLEKLGIIDKGPLLFKSHSAKWIHTLEELADELKTIDEAAEVEQRRISTICESVLSVNPEHLVHGIPELFKDYYERRKQRLASTAPILYCYAALPQPLIQNVLEYIEPNSTIVSECLKNLIIG